MLKDALQFLAQQSADQRKAGIRVIPTPGSVPGGILIANANDKGVYEVQPVIYPMAPPIWVARTIAGFCDFIYNSSKMAEAQWHILIGDDAINAFAFDTSPDPTYHSVPRLKLGLTQTPEWTWVKNGSSTDPKALARFIRQAFIGKNPHYAKFNILKLLPLLSKIAVKITKQSSQSNGQNSDSIGLDVSKQLTMADDAELPEIITVPVSMYKEAESIQYVDMICHFDFDEEQVVLQPVSQSLIDAEDATNAHLVEIIGKGEPKPIVSQVKLLNLHTSSDVNIR